MARVPPVAIDLALLAATHPPPRWEKRASRALRQLPLPILGANTPTNLASELTALHQAFAASSPRAPHFRYAPPAKDVRGPLEQLARQLSSRGSWGVLYAARVEEMWVEAHLCQHAGTPQLSHWARRRYAYLDEHTIAADALARQWAQLPLHYPADEPRWLSDDGDQGSSLLSRMRDEIGRQRLPFRVVVSEQLSALAAIGPGVVYVRPGISLTRSEVERTVLHELKGHALPSVRAQASDIGLLTLGSAGGSDAQEGRALLIERRAGWLTSQRRGELGRRHLAALASHDNVDFVETVALLRRHPTPLADALRIAARAHRGGGLGRERVYLPALLRVSAALDREPALEAWLAHGKLSTAAASTLHAWMSPPTRVQSV